MTDQGRNCEVHGKKGYVFHKFVEDDKLFIQDNALHKYEHMLSLRDSILRHSIAPADIELLVVRRTEALVEAPNGQMMKVDPCEIRFTDSSAAREEEQHD